MKRALISLGVVIVLIVLLAWLAPGALNTLVAGLSEAGGGSPAAPMSSSAPSTSAPSTSAPSPNDSRPSGIPATATPAVIEYVHDGDTLFLEDGRKVRLLGINTPEIGDNAECWGREATRLLRELLPQGTTVWVLEDVEPLDQYGRSLLFVFLEDGTNVNVEMVREGAAEIEQYKPNWLYSDELHDAEDAAYAQRLGIWGHC